MPLLQIKAMSCRLRTVIPSEVQVTCHSFPPSPVLGCRFHHLSSELEACCPHFFLQIVRPGSGVVFFVEYIVCNVNCTDFHNVRQKCIDFKKTVNVTRLIKPDIKTHV